MFKTLIQTASLAAAGTILMAGVAMADPNKYPYRPDTTPLKASKSQPVTHASGGAIMEYPETDPLKASKAQPISHEPIARYDMDDRVDLVMPKPLHWR